MDIKRNFEHVRRFMGYCPQMNMLVDNLTVEETLFYYANLRGIDKSLQGELIKESIANLELEEYAHVQAYQLSGGNKRKLQVAIAILGSPQIVLLDEPSAGMDPAARNQMWKVIQKIVQSKTSSVILTTHSMAEAESVSQKIGIMTKGGVFKCLGTPQHLKDKFGRGFVIEIKAKIPSLDEVD
jgi:ATP-binding cassette, subfamily A (ABC1), member 3